MSNITQRVPSISDVLKKISDDKTLILFNSIAVSNGDRYIPLKEMNLTTKQYYSRIAGLTNAGLIKRHKGVFFLTLLGKVVYDVQMTIGKCLTYYWKLRAIESVEMSSNIRPPKEELTQLINALIDNHLIKDILIKESLSYTFEDRCSCITHINNGNGPVQALDDNAAVCRNVRMVEGKDIVVSKVKDQNKENTSGRR